MLLKFFLKIFILLGTLDKSKEGLSSVVAISIIYWGMWKKSFFSKEWKHFYFFFSSIENNYQITLCPL